MSIESIPDGPTVTKTDKRPRFPNGGIVNKSYTYKPEIVVDFSDLEWLFKRIREFQRKIK